MQTEIVMRGADFDPCARVDAVDCLGNQLQGVTCLLDGVSRKVTSTRCDRNILPVANGQTGRGARWLCTCGSRHTDRSVGHGKFFRPQADATSQTAIMHVCICIYAVGIESTWCAGPMSARLQRTMTDAHCRKAEGADDHHIHIEKGLDLAAAESQQNLSELRLPCAEDALKHARSQDTITNGSRHPRIAVPTP